MQFEPWLDYLQSEIFCGRPEKSNAPDGGNQKYWIDDGIGIYTIDDPQVFQNQIDSTLR